MTELAHSKLKYGLFSRVISCHDRSAQYCQTAYSKCAPCTRTQAFRQRHVSLTPEKRQCHMLDAPGCHHVETQKNRLWTTLHVWQQEICHYAIFTLTPNVSNVTVINPVSGKTLEHPCSTR